MILMFVFGVMNLVWAAALAGFVLVEKVVRGGELVSTIGGAVLIVWGVAALAGV